MKRRMHVCMKSIFLTALTLSALFATIPVMGMEATADASFQAFDRETLARLCDYGALLMVRKNKKGHFKDIAAVTKVHSPPEVIRETLTDPGFFTRAIPDVFKCSTLVSKSEECWRLNQSMIIHVPPFKFKPKWVVEYCEKELGMIDFKPVDGKMDKSYGSWRIEPAPDHSYCLLFLNLYMDIKDLGLTLKTALSVSPDLSIPPQSTFTRRIIDGVKWESEKKYFGIPSPYLGFDTNGFDPEKLHEILRDNVFLLAGFSDGKAGPVICATQINAPVERVWATLLDFEHYTENMPMVKSDVKNKCQDDAKVDVDFTLRIVYFLKETLHFKYRYEWKNDEKMLRFVDEGEELSGSYGFFKLISVEEGRKTLVIGGNYINIKNSGLKKLPSPEPEGDSDFSINQFGGRAFVSMLKVAIEGGKVDLPPGMSQ
ncbi:MAG: hypothetical protein KJ737_23925 [Proteobacteria bacterium]|nr:hypothetical protein [Pseudomonadota bacterium]